MLKFEIVQFDSSYCINLSSFSVWYAVCACCIWLRTAWECACGSAFQKVASRPTLLWWCNEALYLLGFSSREICTSSSCCSDAAFCSFYRMLSLFHVLHSFTRLFPSFTHFFSCTFQKRLLSEFLYFKLFTQFIIIIFFIYGFLMLNATIHIL